MDLIAKDKILDEKASAFLKALGVSIRSVRLERKVTRKSLGHQIGLSVFGIDQLEQGKLDIDMVRVSRIINSLCISPNLLLDRGPLKQVLVGAKLSKAVILPVV